MDTFLNSHFDQNICSMNFVLFRFFFFTFSYWLVTSIFIIKLWVPRLHVTWKRQRKNQCSLVFAIKLKKGLETCPGGPPVHLMWTRRNFYIIHWKPTTIFSFISFFFMELSEAGFHGTTCWIKALGQSSPQTYWWPAHLHRRGLGH